MKTKIRVVALAVAALFVCSANAQTIINDGGTTSFQNGANTTTLLDTNIVGGQNTIRKDVFDGNPSPGAAIGNNVLGDYNILTFSNTSPLQYNSIVGSQNTINANGAVRNGFISILGSQNVAQGQTVTITGSGNNVAGNGHAVLGNHNIVTGQQSVVSGSGNNVSGTINAVYGDFNTVGGTYNSAIGQFIVSDGVASQVLGENVTNHDSFNVILGANSQSAGYNTVSVGAVGAERRIANVADAVLETDAVNLRQLNTGVASAIQQSNAYTDSQIAPLSSRLTSVENRLDNMDARINEAMKEARQGAVLAAAMAPMPPSRVGANTINMAVAGWHGESAIGASLARRVSDDTVIHASISATGSTSMWRVGASHEF